jgi:hypothetical protein
MMPGDDAQQKIEAYLGRLQHILRDMNPVEAGEIVEELRSHVLDKAAPAGQVTAAGVDAALAMLGTPEELATQYTTDALLMRAEISRSPIRIFASLFRWASLSLAGFLVLIASIVGYFLGGAFMWCGVLKIIHPQTAGLWLLHHGGDTWEISVRLGFATVPPDARDVLGWWVVPLGLVVGCALIMLTTHSSLWCVRRYRQSLSLERL